MKKSLAHSVWECKYHIVWVPKNRRKIIYGKLRKDIRAILRRLCQYKGVEVIEGNACIDHIHVCLSIPPKYSVATIVGYSKGKSTMLNKGGNCHKIMEKQTPEEKSHENKIGQFFLAVLLSLCTALFATDTWAEESKTWLKDIWTRDKLTGDWWGGRTYLTDHGIDIGLRLSQYYQSVASGGVDQNSEYGGTIDYRVNVDTNKLFGTWKGMSVNMHARTRFGKDILDDAGGMTIPNTGLLMPLPGDYDGTDITGLTGNQYFPLGQEHLGMLTLGKLDVLDAVTLFFPHVGYGQEGFWNVNSLVSALPWFGAVNGLSLYGGWLATINKEYQMGQSAILVTGTKNVTTEWSSVSDSFDDGAWIAAFHRFFYKLDNKPGYFMVFGGYSTREQTSNDGGDFDFIPGQGIVSTDEENPWDIAAYVSQVFWQAEGDPKRKATILIGGTAGPDDPQFAQYNFFTAVEAYGPMASRPHDRMGVAFWHNWLSDNFKDLVSPVVDLRDTWGFELYYNIEINKWLHLTPDIQFIRNEFKGDDLAVVPGVRLVMDF